MATRSVPQEPENIAHWCQYTAGASRASVESSPVRRVPVASKHLLESSFCGEPLRVNDENARHKAAVQACSGNPSCLAAEETLHEANLAAIEATMEQCKNHCYNEGAGGP